MSSGRSDFSVTLLNERREIARLIQLVEQFGRQAGLVEDDTTDVNIMLDEFVSNVIKYGYDDDGRHEIVVAMKLEDGLLTIRVEDDGKPFNPLDAPEPDLNLPVEQRPIGGLGILIARTMADTIEYERAGDHNVLTLRKTTRPG
jgi:anti-sigma regulatory factor (Ser/Thr protein kinase)